MTSISSSARIRAAYETASSEVDIVRWFQVVYVYGGFVNDFVSKIDKIAKSQSRSCVGLAYFRYEVRAPRGF